jgi:MFS family permease
MINNLKNGEDKQFDESHDISIVENFGWVTRLASAVPAFQNKNYKLYFSGQLISLTGTWIQIVAQGWLVLKLTNSAYYLGLIAALGTLPFLFLTMFGGVIVDQFSKKRILLLTQICSMILAFILGFLTVFKVITVWEIGIIAFLMGIVNAIDSPARQSFVPEIVTKDQLASAIALNSSMFNAARVIGPGLAGILIALIDTGGAFLVNAVSYIAVILALSSMKLNITSIKKKFNPIPDIIEGISYSFSHPVIRILMILIGISSIFGWSYSTIMPIIAQNRYHVGAAGLGYLYAAVGLGAVLGTIIIAVYSKKISSMLFILGGNMMFALSLIAFSFADTIHFALPLLFFAGYGLISQFAMVNTTIQRLVKNELRGRVMSIYVLMFMGLAPIGNYEIGLLSDKFGTALAIRIGAIIVLLAGIIVNLYWNKIMLAYAGYKRNEQ